MSELTKAVSRINNGEACGPDEIPIEGWKIDTFHKLILKRCDNVYTLQSIDEWKEGCIIPFTKREM